MAQTKYDEKVSQYQKGSQSLEYVLVLNPHPRALISRDRIAAKTIQKNAPPRTAKSAAIIYYTFEQILAHSSRHEDLLRTFFSRLKTTPS